MKEKIDKLLNHISVNDALKKSILDQTVFCEEETKTGKGSGSYQGRMRIAAAIAICILLILPTSVFAAHVYFQGFLTKEKDLQQYVSENVFEDSDGHVKIQVKELLSDEMVVMAILHYEALDQEGKQWLDSHSKQVEKPEDSYLVLQPDIKENTNKYGVNYGYGCVEMKKYRTDTERYYCVTVEADRWNPSMKSCILTYMLTGDRWYMGEKHTTKLNTSTNVPIYEYKLQAENHGTLSRFYQPTDIRLSKLSYVVYGQYDDKIWDLSEKQQDAVFISHATLLKEDGSGVSVGIGRQMGEIPQNSLTIRGARDYNCAIVSDSLINTQENLLGIEAKNDAYQNDPAEYVGIRIGNQKEMIEYVFN